MSTTVEEIEELSEEELAKPTDPTLTLEPAEATASLGPEVELTGERWLPKALTVPEWWVLAGPADKMPRAPWDHDGEAFPVKWNRNLEPEERPETSYEEARRWSEFPDHDHLHPTVILPPEHADLTLIDLDDVIRDGEITEPALEILRAAGTYAEVSQSFDGSDGGIHLFVGGHLPPILGKVVEYFDAEAEELGQLEIYDHGRVVVTTGRQIAGTPDRVNPSGQRLIDSLLKKYVPARRLVKRRASEEEIEAARKKAGRAAGSSGGTGSPYWSADVLGVSEPLYANSSGDRVQGCHPGHGATAPNHSDRDSTNFAVFTGKNYWRCFACGSWGGALDLVAVLEGFASCDAMPGYFDRCSDEEFAEVCLAARDKYGFDGDPPYRALVGIARREELVFKDEEEGILGRDGYAVARRVFDRA